MKSIARLFIIVVISGLPLMGCRWFVNLYAFHPDRHDVPAADDLPGGVKEVFLPTSDGETLQCYWVEGKNAKQTLIYFHGNAGNISHRIPDLLMLAEVGPNVLGVGYRGYGKSSGKPSEKGIYMDGRAALDHVKRAHGFSPDQVILMGRSIGSTVAVDLARNEVYAGLILVTPMTTGKAMGKYHGFGLLSALAGDAFNNQAKIGDIRSPLLIIHGTTDNIVPHVMGEQLHARAPEPKSLVTVQGAGHNDISIGGVGGVNIYWKAIRQWIHSLAGDG